MEAGDVFVIPSGERHRLIEGQSPEAWGIRFAPACFGHRGLEGLLTPFTRVSFGASPILRITPDRQEPLHRLCAELERETTRANCEEMGAAAQLSPSLTSRALRFIEENCLEPISLRDVANALERSPAHVATTVKQATGKTVLEWIISGRLTESAAPTSPYR